MSDNSDDELLINTRQKRANAGNRLKHLLELEEREQEELAQAFATEEDENVNLLFQEDEQDEEYSEEESSEEGEDGEGEEEEESADERADGSHSSKKRKRAEDQSDNESDNNEQEVDKDDVFTDSDEDSEESDEEEGEKELQKRERLLKKLKLKKAKLNVIPIIKKPKPAAPKSRSKSHMIDSASLLDSNRRSSSRKAVVENKLATVEKLKQLEERRKLNKPKERVEVYEMTQEERLLEAIETEKQNILSLNRFKEQEVIKKERQRALQLARRIKLTNIIRYVSFPHYIGPLEEIEQERKLQEWLESRREKRGRRRQKVVKEDPAKQVGSADNAEAANKPSAETAESTVVDGTPVNDIPDSKETTIEADATSNGDATVKEELEGPGEVAETDNKPEIDEKESENESTSPEVKLESETVDTEVKDSLNETEETTNNHNDTLTKTEDVISIEEDSSVTQKDEKEDEGNTSEVVENNSEVENVNEQGTQAVAINELSESLENSEEPVPLNSEQSQHESQDEVNSESESGSEPREENGDINVTETSKDEPIVDSEVKLEEEADLKTPPTNSHENADVRRVKFASYDEVVVIPESDSPLPEAVINEVKDETTGEETDGTTIASDKPEGEQNGLQNVKLEDDTNEDIKMEDESEVKVKEDDEEKEEEEKEEEEEEEPKGPDYEGPEQLVSRNLVVFEEFDKEPTIASIKEILLGSQSLLPAQRRSNDVENVLKIRAGTDDDNLEKNLFKTFKELKKQQFKDFYNLPKFGDDLSKLKQKDEDEDEEVVQEVHLNTEAPVGIYLSNGMKKKCLISGKESQYFDPKNGLPYGSVEAYKVLQQVQNGGFTWCQFSSVGGVYLNDRELSPARGCPERF